MKTFVGIDLGSTTTKAVLLDENSDVIGRGITNSRSNYGTAARVASEEARVDGRFTLFRRALNAGGGQSGELDEFLGALERAFRLEQFLEQLDDLEETCRGQIKGERFASVESGVQEALGEVFKRLRAEAPVALCARAPSASRTSSATSPARAITTQAEDVARDAGAALRPAAQRLRQVDHRGGEPAAGGRTQRQVPPRARRACWPPTAWSGPGRPTCRRRSTTRSRSISRKPTWSAPATAASRCRSPRSTSARRSSATGSART